MKIFSQLMTASDLVTQRQSSHPHAMQHLRSSAKLLTFSWWSRIIRCSEPVKRHLSRSRCYDTEFSSNRCAMGRHNQIVCFLSLQRRVYFKVVATSAVAIRRKEILIGSQRIESIIVQEAITVHPSAALESVDSR